MPLMTAVKCRKCYCRLGNGERLTWTISNRRQGRVLLRSCPSPTGRHRHMPVTVGDDLVPFAPVTDAADGLDEKVLSLAGEVVVAVRYFQLTTEVDDRSWERGQGLHVVAPASISSLAVRSTA